MKHTFITISLLFLAAFGAIIFLSYLKKQNEVTKQVIVGPITVECEGAGPQRCYIIKQHPEDQYSLWYDNIAGFDYVEGYEYLITVAETTIENPPADASSINWGLVEVNDKKEVPYLVINNPTEFDNVNSSEAIKVSGKGRGLFEGNVIVEARSLENIVLGQSITTLNAPDLGEEGVWETELNLDIPFEKEGRIVAYSPSPKDGSVNIFYTIRVNFEIDENMEESTPVTSDIEGINWVLYSYIDENGETIEAIPGGTAKFEEGTLNGSTGCNNYFAPYTINENNIEIGLGGSTMMACDENLMVQEVTYLRALEGSASYTATSDSLQLLDNNNNVIISYVK